ARNRDRFPDRSRIYGRVDPRHASYAMRRSPYTGYDNPPWRRAAEPLPHPVHAAQVGGQLGEETGPVPAALADPLQSTAARYLGLERILAHDSSAKRPWLVWNIIPQPQPRALHARRPQAHRPWPPPLRAGPRRRRRAARPGAAQTRLG